MQSDRYRPQRAEELPLNPGEELAWVNPRPAPAPPKTADPALAPVERYQQEKGLPMALLRDLHVAAQGEALAVPYYDQAGRLTATRLRHGPGAASRFTWGPGAQVAPYGLWLHLNRQGKALVLAEGESDAQTLWHLGFPCLGIPGAAAFKAQWAEFIGQRPVYLHQENDRGGAVFVSHTLEALRQGGHRGPVKVFQACQADPRCKDLSDLYLRHGQEHGRRLVAELVKGAGQVNSEFGIRNSARQVNSECGMQNSELMEAPAAHKETPEATEALSAGQHEQHAQQSPDLPNSPNAAVPQHPPEIPNSAFRIPNSPNSVFDAWGLYPLSDLPALAQVPRPPMIVEGMLTAGLTLLAGAPKKGKSWLALKLCLCVATGQPFLGCPVTQGDAIYLDLESRQYRVAQRVNRLCGDRLPHSLVVGHRAPRLEEGFYDMLAGLLKERPQTRLIVVDTLGRVKSPGKGGENAYEADTRLLGQAQGFALNRGISLVLIHHLRKTVGGFREMDVFERVNGSTGLTGACDTVMVLDSRRQEDQARLYVDGRDVPSRQLALGFDAGQWTLLSQDAEQWEQRQRYRQSPLPQAVRALMAQRDRWEGTATDLSRALFDASDGACQVGAREVSGALDMMAAQLEEQEGVAVRRVRVKGSRVTRLLKGPRAADIPPLC